MFPIPEEKPDLGSLVFVAIFVGSLLVFAAAATVWIVLAERRAEARLAMYVSGVSPSLLRLTLPFSPQ